MGLVSDARNAQTLITVSCANPFWRNYMTVMGGLLLKCLRKMNEDLAMARERNDLSLAIHEFCL